MTSSLRNRLIVGGVAAFITGSLAACGSTPPPAENKTAAEEVTAAWVKAFNAGDAAGIAALYAEDGHSMPPGDAAISGRNQIEAYWREDLGSGGLTTKMVPSDSIAQGDLLHVDGLYDVTGKNGVTLAKGQYQQLWRRTDGQWKVQHEIWRLDPTSQRDPSMADQLESLWTTAYNAGDAAGLAGLYDRDAVLSTRPTGSIVGSDAIGSFWKDDFGDGKPKTTLTLTDAYMAGDLAHLEGEYQVTDKGKITKGHYVQLWMQDGNAWRIHREMWWT